MSGFYFVYYAATGCYAPYLALYLSARHLDGTMIGLLVALGPAVGLVTQPLWGHVADRRRASLWVLRLLCAASALAILTVPVLPSALGVPVGIGGGLSLFAAVSSPLVGLADSVTLRFLGARADRYPRVRLWGSVSFAVTSVLSSVALAGRALWRIFPAMAVGIAIAVPLLVGPEPPESLPPPRNPSPAGAPAAAPSPRALLAIGPYVALLACAFLLNVATSAHSTFLPIYLVRLHMPAVYLGTPWAVGAVTEVPMFAAMPAVTDRLGVRLVVLIGLVLYAVRFALMGQLTVAWPALAVQLLQGVTFTFCTAGMVVLAGRLIPPGLKATGQTVFMAVGFLLAQIVGSLSGGIVVQDLGVFWMYRLAGGMALAAATVFAAAFAPWSRDEAIRGQSAFSASHTAV